jgi:hypothetical protein
MSRHEALSSYYPAHAVLARLNEISQENKLGAAPEHHFIKADLTLLAEAKRVAHDVRTRAGPRGIDYLVMCQGALPHLRSGHAC